MTKCTFPVPQSLVGIILLYIDSYGVAYSITRQLGQDAAKLLCGLRE